ncbi:unnamed protein product [Trichogramma brassicae]|uniref:Uncharacterized protein n=1 Tax=Trichogramma brassicae TaxID=86971 RepID=A0A6H5I332_9HYME|nr:unnamed protein product [Trichogramma brassicae]
MCGESPLKTPDGTLAEMLFKTCDELNRLVEVDARDSSGRTPLQVAVKNLQPELVDILLKRGADVSCFVFLLPGYFEGAHELEYYDEQFKLDLASRALTIFEHLEKAGYDPRNDTLIVMKFFEEQKLFQQSVDLDEPYKDEPEVDEAGRPVLRRKTALHQLARDGYSFIIHDLFEIYDRFDVNYVDEDGYTHFHAACISGCANFVQKFLERGQDPDCIVTKTGDSALHLALRYGYDHVSELLLKNGANPNSVNKKGLTPLHVLCKRTHDDKSVERYFEINDENNQTLRINAQDKEGNTPLHYTLKYMDYCYHQVIELLLRRGASPNLADGNGLTTLHVMSWKGYSDLALKLFEICDDRNQTVQIDALDNLGRTPLHFALNWGWPKWAELLLRRGANPNLASVGGLTPLHFICHDRNFKQVDDLAKMFFKICDEKHQLVDIDAKDFLGRTPLDLAVQNLWPDVVVTLLNRGADLSNFAFPSENCFVENYDPEEDSWIVKLQLTSRVLDVVECLKGKGYELDQGDALKIMKFVKKFKMFKKSVEVDENWYRNEELQMKKITVMSSSPLSLYDLIDLPSEEVARRVTHAYFNDFPSNMWTLPIKYHEVFLGRLCEKLTRKFFRGWALVFFLETTRYRLPILCCEMIIEQLKNEDLTRLCLAATTQSDDGSEKNAIKRHNPRPARTRKVPKKLHDYVFIHASASGYIRRIEILRARAHHRS